MAQISVVMPVWNGEKHLRAAIESVLNQTFADFELLVIDDGSADQTLPILRSFPDVRLRIFQRQHEGIVAALNFGVQQAKADWIARMDADDIAYPDRFARQLAVLSKQPDAVLSYSNIELFGETVDLARASHFPRTRALLAMKLCFQSPIVHPSVIFKKSAFEKAGGYLPHERHAEDFGLWGRLIELGPFAGIPAPLLRFRVHQQSISKQKSAEQVAIAKKIAMEHCRRFMQLKEAEVSRAYSILTSHHTISEWLWFLSHCAPRLRWKSCELFGWLAKQTISLKRNGARSSHHQQQV